MFGAAASHARPSPHPRLGGLLLVVLTLLVALAGDATAGGRLKRTCRELCQPYRELCVAADRRGRRRLYRLCWKNLQQSCRLSATQTFPPAPTCTFPCGTDSDCSFGRHCVQNQCIIPPVFSRGGDGEDDDGSQPCADPALPIACNAGTCCPPGSICNTLDPSFCCSTAFPVPCFGTCCPEGATCRSDGRCCVPGAPVECPNVCCRPGYACGANDTCVPDGGTDCSCRCDDGTVCTSHADCGVDSLGIPNICGCPQNPPCDGHGG